ncbi:hypothetical protein L202_08203 [Cryptococcus amylolentus CBS 6039]|uniref:Uncharacterized protein n=1 Tax=Cryptococcus amylolentus CBS 6039 TaxID=1295533 RepID=A0A1E3H8V4_9TREE|nr:hypothetical protein L202_08203 [Cryptococcus amylolentus CBS 6039]ODN72768.1 hypothetical protein L202_08203 [Cryptococcus amylolentus CBS 6039]
MPTSTPQPSSSTRPSSRAASTNTPALPLLPYRSPTPRASKSGLQPSPLAEIQTPSSVGSRPGLVSRWSDWGSESSRTAVGGKKSGERSISGGLRKMFTRAEKKESTGSPIASDFMLVSPPKSAPTPTRSRPVSDYFPNFLKLSSYSTPSRPASARPPSTRPPTRQDDTVAGCTPLVKRHHRKGSDLSDLIVVHRPSEDGNRPSRSSENGRPSTSTTRSPSPLIGRADSLIRGLQSLDKLPESRYPGPLHVGSYGVPTPERPKPKRGYAQKEVPRSAETTPSLPPLSISGDDVFASPISRPKQARPKKSSAPPSSRPKHERPSRQRSQSMPPDEPEPVVIPPIRRHKPSQGSLDRSEALDLIQRMTSTRQPRKAPEKSKKSTDKLKSGEDRVIVPKSLYGGIISESDGSLRPKAKTPYTEKSSPLGEITPENSPSKRELQAYKRMGMSPAAERSPVRSLLTVSNLQKHDSTESFADSLAYLTAPQSPSQPKPGHSTANLSTFHLSSSQVGSFSTGQFMNDEEEFLLDHHQDKVVEWDGQRKGSLGRQASVTDMYVGTLYGEWMSEDGTATCSSTGTNGSGGGLRMISEGPLVGRKSSRKIKKAWE